MNTAVFALNDKTEVTFTEVTQIKFDGTCYNIEYTGPVNLIQLTTDNVLSYTVS